MLYSSKRVNLHMLAVVCLAFAFFLVGINRIPIPTLDGAVRAVMSKELLESGRLWPITYQGEIFTDHPPFFVWLTSLSMKLFGQNDFAVLFVPRFFAFLTVIITALIAIESGFSAGVALLAAVILCLSRDFVLSGVRGYIEPLFIFFSYAGLWFTLHQKRKRNYWTAFVAGIMVFLCAFSKGPVALWPLVLFAILFYWNGQTTSRRLKLFFFYLLGIFLFAAVWAAWVQYSDQWSLWKKYFFEQVLESAVYGRKGAQQLEPTYYLKILAQYYWPWLPILIFSIYRCFKSVLDLNFTSELSYSWIYFICGLGFFVGFSLVKWKFWYYIAPVYPAFALLIATSIIDVFKDRRLVLKLDRRPMAKAVLSLTGIWIMLASFYPVSLYRERVSDVMAFKETIRLSDPAMKVWFVEHPLDHNLVGTSGAWYFGRKVEKVVDQNKWETANLTEPAWIMVGKPYLDSCRKTWCTKAKVIAQTELGALLFYSP